MLDPDRAKSFGTNLATQDPEVFALANKTPVINISPRILSQPLPREFNGYKVWRKYLGQIKDQGSCGACYSYAVTGSMQDRFRLFSANQVQPDLSPLEAVVCHLPGLTPEKRLAFTKDPELLADLKQRTQTTSCQGGSLYQIARHFYRSGAVEEDCISSQMIKKAFQENRRLPTCEDIAGPEENTCGPPPSRQAQRLWPALDFYHLGSVAEGGPGAQSLRTLAEALKYDLFFHGPLVVGFNVFPDFLDTYTGFGVYQPKPDQKVLGGHAVKVIGWGYSIQDQVPYWMCANSWGSDWGDQGYFRIEMANPLLDLERNHLAIIPQVPGIERFFDVQSNASEARAVDMEIRKEIGVHPFTLYDKVTTAMILDGTLTGPLYPPVFNQVSYDPSPKILGCTSCFKHAGQFPYADPWQDPDAAAAAMALIIVMFGLLGLGGVRLTAWLLSRGSRSG